jgi:hypothetical protein
VGPECSAAAPAPNFFQPEKFAISLSSLMLSFISLNMLACFRYVVGKKPEPHQNFDLEPEPHQNFDLEPEPDINDAAPHHNLTCNSSSCTGNALGWSGPVPLGCEENQPEEPDRRPVGVHGAAGEGGQDTQDPLTPKYHRIQGLQGHRIR